MEIIENRNKRSGLVGTLIFHGVLLLILLILALKTPLPLPAEEGIVVNFGTSETGSGNIQPQEKSEFDNLPKNESATSAAASAPESKEEAITQDIEEAPHIKKETKPVKTPVKKPVIKPKETTKPVAETKPKEIKETPKETPKEEPKVNPKALYQGKKDPSQNTSTSQGTGTTPGDQGKPQGTLDGGDGSGKGKAGVGYDLSGRKWRVKPEIYDNSQEFGVVVIDITVDKYGNVIAATGPSRGSTTTSSILLSKAREAALKAKFNQDLNDLEIRKGTITFIFSPK